MSKKVVLLNLSFAIMLLVPSPAIGDRTWRGEICSIWKVSGNWERKSVPRYYDAVFIEEAVRFDPEIAYDHAWANRVVIGKGGCLTISDYSLTTGEKEN